MKKIIPKQVFASKNNAKLKVVFMMSDFCYNVNPNMVYDTFEVLNEIKGIDLYVKPHTRSNKIWQFQNSVEKFNLKLLILHLLA